MDADFEQHYFTLLEDEKHHPALKRMATFDIIANNADGYGVDRCLASGAACGAAVATAYCKARDFAQAQSFHKIDRDEITGAVRSSSESCHGSSCDDFVAIECTR